MRRYAALVALVALMIGALPAHAQVYARRDAMAIADWLIPTTERGHFKWYAAFAFERTDVATGEEDLLGAVVRGSCVRVRRPKIDMMNCFGRGDPIGGKDHFSMQLDASAAELHQETRSHHNVVRWRALQDVTRGFGNYHSEEACTEGRGFGGGIVRGAETEARIFGRRLRSNDRSQWEWHALWSGAMATQCGPLSAEEVQDILDGGTVWITKQRSR